jgi:AcrR family transcriptional regulator
MENIYHHGDLKNELIQVGIKVVTNEGMEKLSLRKIAALCNVSEAAPYKHFKNKNELLEAMQDYIKNKLMLCLTRAVENSGDPNSPDAILNMGKAYVFFFIEYPEYFTFLFSSTGLHINLTLSQDAENFMPFQFFRDKAYSVYTKMGFENERIKYGIISMWAKVHGIAAISSMKNIVKDFEWEDVLDKILVD